MVTVLEECTAEEQPSVVRVFLWAKGLSAKDIHKEMLSVYGEKCLSLKAVHNRVEKCGKYFPDDEEFETEVWNWLGQQSKNFHSAGFLRTSEAMEIVYEYWWRIY
jgi:hypothetical protein